MSASPGSQRDSALKDMPNRCIGNHKSHEEKCGYPLTVDTFLNPFETFPREQHMRSPIRELDGDHGVGEMMQHSVLHCQLRISSFPSMDCGDQWTRLVKVSVKDAEGHLDLF